MDTLGNYKLLKVLGQGCYATVYLASHIDTKRKYAIKSFSKKKVREIHLSQELEAFFLIHSNPHPNVVECVEMMETEDHLFLVQEYLPQGDLLTYLSKKSKLDQFEAKKLFWGLLKAVDHLHTIGIVHRDLKLENICVDEHGEPKVIDFNLSGKWSNDQQLNRFCGSMGYCAPEIILKRPYRGPEVDIWSLGVMLYIMNYFSFPFSPDPSDMTEEAKKRRVKEKTLEARLYFPKSEKRDEVEELISSMLVVDPSHRISLKMVMNHSWLKEVREHEKRILQQESEKSLPKRTWESVLFRILG